MSEQSMNDFVEKIENTLTKNGYPEKRVALPLERMYESAYQKGLNFNRVLDVLSQRGISHEKTNEKFIFFPSLESVNSAEFSGVDFSEMMSKAAELLKGMSPEQIAEMQRMVSDLTPEQREEMMRKARDLGISP